MKSILRHKDGLWPNLAAFSYGFGGWALGLVLCASPYLWLNAAGVLLLAHSLVICAYLLHECAHNTIFADPRANAGFGALLAWQTGACYSPYPALRDKHFRHHVDNADVLGLDHRTLLTRRPALRHVILPLEWAYVPALDWLMHALAMALPFWKPAPGRSRRRVIALLAARVGMFAILGLISAKALLLYAAAYALFLHVMRFFDVHQHTYEVFETGGDSKSPLRNRGDGAYEQMHTYSNLLSARFPGVNLLALNFPYHNAHHARPTEPWYRLPSLHRQLFAETCAQALPFRNLLASYHRHRVARLMGIDGDEVGAGASRGRDFVGALGVSFLVAH